MLHTLPPTFKPVNNLVCCKTGLTWMVKCITSLFNSFCGNVARQVACFLLPVFPYLKKLLYLFKVVLSTSKHLQASFQGSKRTDVPHTNYTKQSKLINYKTIIF